MARLQPNTTEYWAPVAVFGVVCLAMAGAQWIFYLHVLHTRAGIRLLTPVLAGLIAAVLTRRLCRERSRQLEHRERREALLAAMNHQVRNALDAISSSTFVDRADRSEIVRVAAAQIQLALNTALAESERERAAGAKTRPGQLHGRTQEFRRRGNDFPHSTAGPQQPPA